MVNADAPKIRLLTGDIPCAVYPPHPSPNGHRPALVVHLYGSSGTHKECNVMRPPFARLRRLLAQRGVWLIVPELGPRHWMNERTMTIVDTAIAHMIKTENVDQDRIHFLGTSMGAGSGLAYVARRPGVVRSMCAFFPMTDWQQWVREQPSYLPRIANAHGVDPKDTAKLDPLLRDLSPMSHLDAYVSLPLLVLHGDADKTVPTHHSRDFVAALRAHGASVTYHEAPGLKHDNAVAEPFQEEIADFFTKA